MAQLTLHIIGNTDDIDKKLNLVKEKIKSLGEQSIKFSVDEKGVEAAVAQLKNFTAEQIKATEAAAKLANAEARKINAQTKAAESAAKLSKEAKKHAEATQQAAKETEHFALTNEQVKQKMLDTAKQTDYLRGKVSELYTQYLSITKESSGVASGQEQIATSMALVVRNAGTLQVQIRALTTAYNELRQASGSGGVSSQYGGRFLGRETQPQLGSGINWTYGRGYDIEIDTTQVKGAANAVNDVADAMGKASSVTERMSQNWKQFVDNTRSADNASKGLLGTLGQYINWYLRWTLVSEAFQAMVSSIKNAIKTMKDVDQELTNIQKVSDLTAQEVAKIGDAAYDAASKFGVAATDYLSAVYTFQKAGLGDSATQMAELATKTMLVGDTSADVASKFLIAVNAAWQLNGSITALNKVVDEADYINNNYATDLAKLSAGMPIVASTAANLNMSIEETLAVLGTITAATQETGTKAATAWRALAMNITGEIGTIIDETGETIEVTEESVKSIADALKIYGNDAVKAAQETGQLIDPMEAVISLAEAYKDGLLDDIELQNILMGVGGKLRTNQLTALVRDLASETSTYYDIMSHLGEAAGTADKEVATMLDSWNAKTQILTNTWTKFISHLIDSKQIKSGIDALTTAVKFLDSGFGKFAVTAGLLATATTLLTKTFIRMPAQLATIALKATMGATAFAAMSAEELAAAVASMTLGEALKAIGVALINNPVTWIAAASVALYGLIKLADKLNVTYEEHLEKLDELQSKYDELYGTAGELETLKERVGELTDKELERLGVLEAQKQQLEEQIKKEKELTFQAWLRSQVGLNYVASPTGTLDVQYYDKTKQALDDATKAYHSLGAEMDAGQHTNEKYVAGLNKIINALKEDAEAIKLGKEAGQTLTPTQEALLALYESLTLEVGKYTQKTELETKAKQDNADATSDAAEANEALKKALDEVDKKGSLTYGTLEELDKLYPGLSKKILDANGNLTAEGKAALATKSAFYQLIAEMISANNTSLSFAGQIDALYELAIAAGVAEGALSGIFSGLTGGPTFGEDGQIDVASEKAYARAQANPTRTISGIVKKIQAEFKKGDYITGEDGGYGGDGSAETPQEKEQKRLKQIVADEKARYALLEEMGASAETLAAQALVVRDAIAAEADYLDSIGANYSDIAALVKERLEWQAKAAEEEADELQAHKDKVALLKQELAFLKASGASDAEIVAKQKEIQRALHDQAKYMRSIKADEKDIKALSTEWWDIQNDILDTTKRLAEELRGGVANVLEELLDGLSGAEEALVTPLQGQLDALNEAHDATKGRRTEEEKIAAVQEKQLQLEKAQIALRNAQNERTVRSYNAKSGKWEWTADAKQIESAQKNVETAQKNLIDAQTALAEYYADQEYQTLKLNLERQIKNTNNAFSSLNKAIQDAAKAIRDGKMTFEEAYAYIRGELHRIYDEYEVDLTATLHEASAKLGEGFSALFEDGRISDTVKNKAVEAVGKIMSNAETAADNMGLFSTAILSALQTDNPADAIEELSDAIRNGTIENLDDINAILKALNGEYAGLSTTTARMWALAKMQSNSIAWHLTDDQTTKDALHEQNMALGTSMGLTYSNGKWYDSDNNQVYTLSNEGGNWTSALNAGSSASTGTTTTNTTPTTTPTTTSTTSGTSTTTTSGTAAKGTKENPIVDADGFQYWKENGYFFVATPTGGKHSNISAQNVSKRVVATMTEGNLTVKRFADGHMEGYNASGTLVKKTQALIYDAGGILNGIGGIKATREDEMVLPPDATKAMLNAEASGAFNALLNHLGIVTAAANQIAGFGGGVANNSIGEQNNGDNYNFGNITLTEQQARSMTVYDLAQMSRNLGLSS